MTSGEWEQKQKNVCPLWQMRRGGEVASGEVASGEWRVASGEWRVASGEWEQKQNKVCVHCGSFPLWLIENRRLIGREWLPSQAPNGGDVTPARGFSPWTGRVIIFRGSPVRDDAGWDAEFQVHRRSCAAPVGGLCKMWYVVPGAEAPGWRYVAPVGGFLDAQLGGSNVPPSTGTVVRIPRVGGLINHYERVA